MKLPLKVVDATFGISMSYYLEDADGKFVVNSDNRKDLIEITNAVNGSAQLAAQVAGAELDSEMMLWDASDTEGTFGNGAREFAETYASNCMTRGDILEVAVQCAHRLEDRKMRIEVTEDEENWLKWEWIGAHPAPEPVSVPLKWELRDVAGYGIANMEAEIAEWRALAAERGWVK